MVSTHWLRLQLIKNPFLDLLGPFFNPQGAPLFSKTPTPFHLFVSFGGRRVQWTERWCFAQINVEILVLQCDGMQGGAFGQ
jgi:hypothetical protein